MSEYFNQNKFFNNFNGMSNITNTFSNFDKSFLSNQQIIGKNDFKNKNDLIHNNLSDNILFEKISDYQINVDSNDRKINVYPNPFKFTVNFGGSGSQVLNTKNTNKYKDDKIDDTYFEGTPGPVIDRKFKNVKYIKIDYLILPRIIKLCNSNGKYEFETNETNSCLTSFGYLILKINEMSSSRILGTNNLLSDNSFVLYPDKTLGNDYIMWVTSIGSKFFNNSNLGNLDKLTISILTPNGKQLAFIDSKGKDIDFRILYDNKRTCTEHPSLDNILPKLRCFISFIVGVVENELNTLTKYDN